MKTVQVRVLIALALLAMVPVSGCHTGLNEVTGKVTLDGRTVPGMEVRFEPKDPNIGTTAIGYTQADGSYTLHYPGDKTVVPGWRVYRHHHGWRRGGRRGPAHSRRGEVQLGIETHGDREARAEHH